jgi:hypothetical protein
MFISAMNQSFKNPGLSYDCSPNDVFLALILKRHEKNHQSGYEESSSKVFKQVKFYRGPDFDPFLPG